MTTENSEKDEKPAKNDKISLGESAKILFGRAARKVKGAASVVKDSAVGVAEVVKDSTVTAATATVSAVKTATEEVAEWNPLTKVTEFPQGLREVVKKAREANSLDDICQKLTDVDGLVKFLQEEKETLCLKVYAECPHEKIVKVRAETKLITSSPAYKLCLKCGIAEEGAPGDWSTSHYRLTADGAEMARKEAEPRVLRKFSQEEIRKLKTGNNAE